MSFDVGNKKFGSMISMTSIEVISSRRLKRCGDDDGYHGCMFSRDQGRVANMATGVLRVRSFSFCGKCRRKFLHASYLLSYRLEVLFTSWRWHATTSEPVSQIKKSHLEEEAGGRS